ncbi:hypothetical protein FB446DRAFT_265316 [Lentinula raphanica]|nr:hypothetical protein FB446DRAFT_265316 [Lentinula raphanica]
MGTHTYCFDFFLHNVPRTSTYGCYPALISYVLIMVCFNVHAFAHTQLFKTQRSYHHSCIIMIAFTILYFALDSNCEGIHWMMSTRGGASGSVWGALGHSSSWVGCAGPSPRQTHSYFLPSLRKYTPDSDSRIPILFREKFAKQASHRIR